MAKSDSQSQIFKEMSRHNREISPFGDAVIGFFQSIVPRNKKPGENPYHQLLGLIENALFMTYIGIHKVLPATPLHRNERASEQRIKEPSYGIKPAYPSCPQDTTGAGQGGNLSPLHPPAGLAVACPAERPCRSWEANL